MQVSSYFDDSILDLAITPHISVELLLMPSLRFAWLVFLTFETV